MMPVNPMHRRLYLMAAGSVVLPFVVGFLIDAAAPDTHTWTNISAGVTVILMLGIAGGFRLQQRWQPSASVTCRRVVSWTILVGGGSYLGYYIVGAAIDGDWSSVFSSGAFAGVIGFLLVRQLRGHGGPHRAPRSDGRAP